MSIYKGTTPINKIYRGGSLINDSYRGSTHIWTRPRPTIVVSAPASSTLDIIQSGVILQTYTLSASETSHTFTVEIGTYDVRGTNGSKTKTNSVTCSSNTAYSTTIDYTLYLVKNGVIQVPFTADSKKVRTQYTSAFTPSISNESGRIRVYANSDTAKYTQQGSYHTTNLINCSAYTTAYYDLYITMINENLSYSGCLAAAWTSSDSIASKALWLCDAGWDEGQNDSWGRGTASMNISSNSQLYFGVGIYRGTCQSNIYVYNIYLV